MTNAVQQVADVIKLPTRSTAAQATSVASEAFQHIYDWTGNEVDDWGRDNGFVNRVWSFTRFRWSTSVGGAEHIPKRAGALIVINSRRFALAPIFTAMAIGGKVNRPVRFVGRPDIAPFGPMMQRLGGLLPIEDEVEGALRAGELVVLGAEHESDNGRCGIIDHRLVGAAVAARVRVLPTATTSLPIRRTARVEIGAPVRPHRRRRGPLGELELADLLQDHIDEILHGLGGNLTGTPLDWLPIIGIGGI